MITTEIDSKIAAAAAGIITEQVDYKPGEFVTPNFMNMAKLGSGGRGHVYVGIWTPYQKNELSKIKKEVIPYFSHLHFLNLLIRKKKSMTDTPEKKNQNRRNVKEQIDPVIETIKRDLKLTRSCHNYAELRAITGTPKYKLAALKFISHDMIEDMKKDDPEMESEFKKEIDMLNKVNHASIPGMIEYVETDKGIGYICSHIDGNTIDELTAPETKFWREDGEKLRQFLPPKVTLAIMNQFYDALAHIHRKKIIYQDIQQGNIMVDYDGVANIIDFGFTDEIKPDQKYLEIHGGDENFFPPEIAKQLQETKGYEHEVKEGHMLPLHLNSSIWSAGVLTYFMMTDRYPFEDTTFSRLSDKILTSKHINPRNYNSEWTKEEIEYLINNPLQKDPENRSSASQLEKITRMLLEKRMRSDNITSREEVVVEFMKPKEIARAKAFVSAAPLPENSTTIRRSGSRRSRNLVKPQAA